MWRLAPDRVLLRTVETRDWTTDAVDLLGTAGLVWLAIDEPATITEVIQRVNDAEIHDVDADSVVEACRELLEAGWVLEAE